MTSAKQSFNDWRLSSYLLRDMTLASDKVAMPIHANAPIHAFKELSNECDLEHKVQRIMPESFRYESSLHSDCIEWKASRLSLSQKEKDSEYKFSESWEMASDLTKNFEKLPIGKKIALVRLQLSLGLHSSLANSKFTSNNDYDEQKLLALKYMVILSKLAIHYDFGTPFDIDELLSIVKKSKRGGKIHIASSHALLIYSIKSIKNKSIMYKAAKEMEIANSKEKLSCVFSENLSSSKFYRGISMVAMIENRKKHMSNQMDLSEKYARSAYEIAKNSHEEIIARENLMTVLESRSKEALLINDLEIAKARANEQVQLDPYDPKNHIELGNILLRNNDYDDALKSFQNAVNLGTPGIPVALYMCGRSLEYMGDYQSAISFYLQTLSLDPLGTSAINRLNEIFKKTKKGFTCGFEQWLSYKKEPANCG